MALLLLHLQYQQWKGISSSICNNNSGILTNLVVNESLNLNGYSHFWETEEGKPKKFCNPFHQGLFGNLVEFWFGGK